MVTNAESNWDHGGASFSSLNTLTELCVALAKTREIDVITCSHKWPLIRDFQQKQIFYYLQYVNTSFWFVSSQDSHSRQLVQKNTLSHSLFFRFLSANELLLQPFFHDKAKEYAALAYSVFSTAQRRAFRSIIKFILMEDNASLPVTFNDLKRSKNPQISAWTEVINASIVANDGRLRKFGSLPYRTLRLVDITKDWLNTRGINDALGLVNYVLEHKEAQFTFLHDSIEYWPNCSEILYDIFTSVEQVDEQLWAIPDVSQSNMELTVENFGHLMYVILLVLAQTIDDKTTIENVNKILQYDYVQTFLKRHNSSLFSISIEGYFRQHEKLVKTHPHQVYVQFLRYPVDKELLCSVLGMSEELARKCQVKWTRIVCPWLSYTPLGLTQQKFWSQLGTLANSKTFQRASLEYRGGRNGKPLKDLRSIDSFVYDTYVKALLYDSHFHPSGMWTSMLLNNLGSEPPQRHQQTSSTSTTPMRTTTADPMQVLQQYKKIVQPLPQFTDKVDAILAQLFHFDELLLQAKHSIIFMTDVELWFDLVQYLMHTSLFPTRLEMEKRAQNNKRDYMAYIGTCIAIGTVATVGAIVIHNSQKAQALKDSRIKRQKRM